MMMADTVVLPAAALEEAKNFLRLEHGREDGVLGHQLAAATGLCEAFTGRALLARELVEVMPASAAWVRLGAAPVRAILAVEALVEGGSTAALPVGGYAIDIDAAGEGWVRVTVPGVERLQVRYRAGLADGWGELPEPLRQGVVRLAGHLFTERGDGNRPPAAVTALWRPWRRVRL